MAGVEAELGGCIGVRGSLALAVGAGTTVGVDTWRTVGEGAGAEPGLISVAVLGRTGAAPCVTAATDEADSASPAARSTSVAAESMAVCTVAAIWAGGCNRDWLLPSADANCGASCLRKGGAC